VLATRLLLQRRGGKRRNGALFTRPLAALCDNRVSTIQPSDCCRCYLRIELENLPLIADEGGWNDQVARCGWSDPDLDGGVVAWNEGADGALWILEDGERGRLRKLTPAGGIGG
jgi:hypothetical protein